MTLWLWMSGKRNVSVCRGHELANALYVAARLLSAHMSYRNNQKKFSHYSKHGMYSIYCLTSKRIGNHSTEMHGLEKLLKHQHIVSKLATHCKTLNSGLSKIVSVFFIRRSIRQSDEDYFSFLLWECHLIAFASKENFTKKIYCRFGSVPN